MHAPNVLLIGTSRERGQEFVFGWPFYWKRINWFAQNWQVIKPRRLKFGLNIAISKSVVCANFGIVRHVIVN